MRPKPVRRQTLDPSVADILRDMDSTQAVRKLPKREREAAQRKVARAAARDRKERARQAARVRLTADVPREVFDYITALAASHSVPVSGLVALACHRLIVDIGNGFNFDAYKKPSRSPRYGWIIEVPEKIK